MDPCSICLGALDGTVVVTLGSCGHAFHAPCLRRWLRRSARCPLCRRGCEDDADLLLDGDLDWTPPAGDALPRGRCPWRRVAGRVCRGR